MTAFVSNGNGTPRVLDYLRPWVDLYKVDLKSFDDRHYRQLGGRLEPDPRDDSCAARDGHLARDRDAADSGLQRFARGARSPDELRGRRVTRHPVARDRVPQGLPDDRSGQHDAGDARRCRGRSVSGTDCGTSTPAICRDESAISRTRAATTAARCSSSATGITCCRYRLTPAGACPDCGTSIPGRWGARFEGQISARAVPAGDLRQISALQKPLSKSFSPRSAQSTRGSVGLVLNKGFRRALRPLR